MRGSVVDVDHIVLWVDDFERSLEFYTDVLGFDAVRAEEFHTGKARFPSIRINGRTIFDIMERGELLSLVQNFTGSGDCIGDAAINHVCLSMSASEYTSISKRLVENGVDLHPGGENVFGAQGQAVRSVYFNDPDGNVLEIRYYKE